jgi:hypothetical protein
MRHPLRPGLPELPPSMRKLPVDARGFPVPFFVAWLDGKPDHRVVEPIKLLRCIRDGVCWICGERLTLPVVCVIGPMCGVNHVSSEPPSHEACARFSVSGCPFLSRPSMRRREAGLPEELIAAPGVALLHNPGVSLLWWTERVEVFKVKGPKGSTHRLFDIGEPQRVEWWTEGRLATRDEAIDAIILGLPKLMEQAGGDAAEIASLGEQARALRRWLPEEVAA